MQKPASTAHPILELIRERWSPRAFAAKPVETAKLLSVLEAARWAPSSYNGQPWSFILARAEDKEGFAKLLGCLVEQNREWAGKAPVLLISIVKHTFDYNGKPNRCAVHDVGLASENMVLEAVAQGLCTHGMAGIQLDKIKEEYFLPEDCEAVAAWALGYPGEPDQLEGALKERELAPRERKDLSAFVFGAKFGEKSEILGV